MRLTVGLLCLVVFAIASSSGSTLEDSVRVGDKAVEVEVSEESLQARPRDKRLILTGLATLALAKVGLGALGLGALGLGAAGAIGAAKIGLGAAAAKGLYVGAYGYPVRTVYRYPVYGYGGGGYISGRIRYGYGR